jgi:hypothetical protein
LNQGNSTTTSVLDSKVLPPLVVADLYQRWRIKEAFFTVKCLLGLSYLWTGSVNGFKLQLWAKALIGESTPNFPWPLVEIGEESANID